MRLTPEQQAIVEQALVVVPRAIAAFAMRYPTLRKQMRQIDTESVANLAICKAAVTYKPEKSAVTTYFSMAIRNAILKEIDRNRRANYGSAQRVPMELAESLAAADERINVRIQRAIQRLPAKARTLIRLRYYRRFSLREIGELVQADPRTVKKRLDVSLDALQSLLQNDPLMP